MAAAIIINKNKKKKRGHEHDNINDAPATLYVSSDRTCIHVNLQGLPTRASFGKRSPTVRGAVTLQAYSTVDAIVKFHRD